MTEQYDPREPQASRLSVVIGGIAAIPATIAILLMSGTIGV